MTSNKFLYIGLGFLIISLIVIYIGLKDSNGSKTFFNISRLLALLSVAGIWYFGNVLTKSTTLQIEETKKETAEAINKQKQFEVDLAKANIETEEARERIEVLKLEVEQEKTERFELELRAKTLETKDKILSKNRRIINQLSINVTLSIPTISTSKGTRKEKDGFNIYSKPPATLILKSGENFNLVKDAQSYYHQIDIETLEIGISLSPNSNNSIALLDINFFDSVEKISLFSGMFAQILEGMNAKIFDTNKPMKFEITFILNGKKFQPKIQLAPTQHIVLKTQIYEIDISAFSSELKQQFLKTIEIQN